MTGKRVGLALSAGFFGFYAHAGLLAALEGAGIAPAAVSGSSAGAMIGALHGAGVDANTMAGILGAVRRQDFWDPLGPAGLLRGGFLAPGLLRGEKFRRLMERHLPVNDFSQCRIPVYLEATNLTRGTQDLLSSGDLARSVVASSAYPGLFAPVELNGCFYWDGGLVNKIPLTCMLDDAEVILVHWLASRSLTRLPRPGRGLGSVLAALVRGQAISRSEYSILQARVALERGIPVHVITPQDLPRAGPMSLDQGPPALRMAREWAREALARPAGESRLDPEMSLLRVRPPG